METPVMTKQPQPKSKLITRQKIQAVLRKAGHQASKYHPSGQVRGWGRHSRGYSVTENKTTNEFLIEERGLSFSETEMAGRMAGVYADALRAAGIRCEMLAGEVVADHQVVVKIDQGS